ncbi:nitrogenase cofactor biosynthesis protein NifB [Sporolactobacillus shoreicorticis]|uniref:FeMo cofactor biosynthesis protein NifB n=1 Tax=Sporolactobacillus shoreicorticis TaxID=1923877 RepID=A0ABW5RY39_9BACL|nr:nitrogenase cofactor biosynthesis protein NifB [Sporolactobacillus shoreicorticis]MCO7124868.1 nitrogenase cofactor biosynthesis protein NifB [Sporolactobacillus shoreicorticis]
MDKMNTSETMSMNEKNDPRSRISWNFNNNAQKKKIAVLNDEIHLEERTREHPCFGPGACRNARVHLPIAPRCNIQCNYCVRKFDCCNESRPGVTSKVLSANEAFEQYIELKKHLKNLKVVGIAGPGDALANFEETKKTLKLIRMYDPEVTFCISTNGLMLPFYARELVELGVTHFTVTVNAVDVEIGAKIYKHINYFGKLYSGREAATILMANQLAGLKLLKEYEVVTKINCVALKGINDHHIPDVIKKVKDLGIYMSNIMPHIPVVGSVFEYLDTLKSEDIDELRNVCEIDLKQMRHCRQCRADAVGTLDNDLSLSEIYRQCSTKCTVKEKMKPKQNLNSSTYSSDEERKKRDRSHLKRYAVATSNGAIVDTHFGQAEEFYIYESDGKTTQFVEKRRVEHYCNGYDDCQKRKEDKWEGILKTIVDCSGVLALRIGKVPNKKLLDMGIDPIVTVDTVAHAVNQAAQSARSFK